MHGTLTWSGYLASISFSDAEHGLLTTGRGGLLATLDGGSSWRTVLVTDDVTDVVAAQWVAGRLVVLLLNGALLSSSDGGMTWRRLYPQTLPAPFETSFSGVEEGIGAGSSDWATGREVVVVTHDGGRTWHYRGALPDGMAIVRLFRVDADVVMATARVLGRSGTRLYRSLDDGRSWKRMRTPVASRYVAVSFATAHRGVLADDDGRFYRTSDGGRSWALLGSAGLDLRDFTLLTRTHGFAIAYDTLYETTDGARSWHFYNAPVERPLAIATHGSRHVWILGLPVCDERISRRQPNCPGTLATSDDGGDTWRRIRLNMIPGVIDVELVTPDTAYADGFVTRDRGLTWRLVRSR